MKRYFARRADYHRNVYKSFAGVYPKPRAGFYPGSEWAVAKRLSPLWDAVLTGVECCKGLEGKAGRMAQDDEPIDREWLDGVSLANLFIEVQCRDIGHDWRILAGTDMSKYSAPVRIPTPPTRGALLRLLAGLGIGQQGGGA